jgi:uncharacterized protein
MISLRTTLAVAALAFAPLASWAQGATPLLDTSPNGSPTIPFGGFNPDFGDRIPARAAANNASDVLGLVLQGDSPDGADESGRTGLMYAAINNNQVIGKILLDHGAHCDPRDRFGNTALHWAAQSNSLGMIHQLVTFGCLVDAQNKQGVTPLMMAAQKGRADAVRELLAAKADPRVQDYTGRDATGWAANGSIAQLLTAGAAR